MQQAWRALQLPEKGIISLVGAGGKTSLALSLLAEAQAKQLPTVLTTTTKMHWKQLAQFRPIVADSAAETAGRLALRQTLGQTAAWIGGWLGEKAVGVEPEEVDWLLELLPEAVVLVEADGAKGCWLKAPSHHEPVVPQETAVTIGVLNIRALGKNLEGKFVYRLPEVCGVLGKEPGSCVELRDYALLAASPKGIFQHAHGRRILLLTGGEKYKDFPMEEFVSYLHAEQANIERCALAYRNEKTMLLEVLEVREL
nr:selenium cofactor biosynthesis protein YqeC [uncultured Anaeromusa sp.]